MYCSYISAYQSLLEGMILFLFLFLLVLIMILSQKIQISPLQRAQRLGLSEAGFSVTMSAQTKKAIDEIKRKDRPKLKIPQWNSKCYATTNLTELLLESQESIERRSVQDLTVQQFRQQYEQLNKPVIIKGCTKGWRAEQQWTMPRLLQRLGTFKFKVGEDDQGQKLRLSFRDYLQYMINNDDDSPLYLFQQGLEEKEETRKLVQDYHVPVYFQEDFFRFSDHRPPFRWLIIGPQRSGSSVHTDPQMTSAWNTSLVGFKRWVLFGPQVPKSIVKGSEFISKDYKGGTSQYFAQTLPRIRQKYSKSDLELQQFVQKPGQTVFVPGGTWHAVINLTDTIAITQNVMTSMCFDKVWRSTRVQRTLFAIEFLQQLKNKNVTLYQRAITVNKHDKYEMGNKYQQQQVQLSFTPSQSSFTSSSKRHSQFQQFQPKERQDRYRNAGAFKGSDRSNSSFQDQTMPTPKKRSLSCSKHNYTSLKMMRLSIQ